MENQPNPPAFPQPHHHSPPPFLLNLSTFIDPFKSQPLTYFMPLTPTLTPLLTHDNPIFSAMAVKYIYARH